MKKFIIPLVLVFATLSVFGHQKDYRKSVRNLRISQGIEMGELDRVETRKLVRERKRIHKVKNLAKCDGKITPKERRQIRRMQLRAQRHLIREMRD